MKYTCNSDGCGTPLTECDTCQYHIITKRELDNAPIIIEVDKEETEDFICDYGGDCENCEWTTCPDSEVERE